MTLYPFRHGETTLYPDHVGDNRPSRQRQRRHPVRRPRHAAGRRQGQARQIAVETPLNKLAGFDLVTVWLNDPDGVTNYFAQVGPNSRTARAQAKGN